MFEIKIISCSNGSYWYSNNIGKTYIIDDQHIQGLFISRRYKNNLITRHYKISEYMTCHGNLEKVLGDTYRIKVTEKRTVDLCDVKITTLRELKIRKILDAISKNTNTNTK